MQNLGNITQNADGSLVFMERATLNGSIGASGGAAFIATANFGAVGNIPAAGVGMAGRAVFNVPNRSFGASGAAAAGIQIDMVGGGSSATFASGTIPSFLRMALSGTWAGSGNFNTNGYLFDLNGLTAGSTNLLKLLDAAPPANTAGSLRIRIGTTDYFLMIYATRP